MGPLHDRLRQSNRLNMISSLVLHDREIQTGVVQVAIGFQGAREEFSRAVQLTGFDEDHAESVQRVRVFGVDRERGFEGGTRVDNAAGGSQKIPSIGPGARAVAVE